MPQKKPARSGRAIGKRHNGAGKRFDDVAAIIEAARACFARYGAARTRLEDVAKEVGISRPLLYQFFANREALMDAVINREIEIHLEAQAKKMPRYASFTETVIEASVIAINLARRDGILYDLMEHSSVKHLPELLLNPDRPVHHTVLKLWRPIFNAARQRGELRADLDDHDIMEWLLSVNYMFGLRDDMTPERQHQMLTLFVAPALAPGGRLVPATGGATTQSATAKKRRKSQ